MSITNILSKPFTALAGKVNHSVESKILAAVARHAAGALGGFLVAHGLIAASAQGSVEDAIGALLMAIAASSSIAQKLDENKL